MATGEGRAQWEPSRRRVTTSDPEQAVAIIRDGYEVDARPVLSGDPTGFEFTHDALGCDAFAVNRLRHTMSIGYDTQPREGLLVVNRMHAGRLTLGNDLFGETCLGPGDVALNPPDGDTLYTVQDVDISPVTLSRARIADYAVRTCGIEPGALRFTGIRPVSAAMAGLWLATVEHVHDVLATPFAAGSPIVVESAFRSLAAAFLSTFPNTALAAATDPHDPGARGDVPAATLREVVDHLDQHADLPVGPDVIAGLAGRPARDVVESLRRRDGTHPARLLWDARLRGVRSGLRESDAREGHSVAAVAAAWGFTDLRRFRVAYRRVFDETPEDTLGG